MALQILPCVFAVQFKIMQAGYLVLLRHPRTGNCSFESNCSQVSNEEMRYGGSYINLIISGTPSVMCLG